MILILVTVAGFKKQLGDYSLLVGWFSAMLLGLICVFGMLVAGLAKGFFGECDCDGEHDKFHAHCEEDGADWLENIEQDERFDSLTRKLLRTAFSSGARDLPEQTGSAAEDI